MMLYNFFSLVVSFFLVQIVGKATLSFLNVAKTNFSTLLTGSIVIPLLYSLFVSKGVTVLIIIPLIMSLYLLLVRGLKFKMLDLKSIYFDKSLFLLLPLLMLLFLVHYNYFIDYMTGELVLIKSDYSFYSRLASYLRDYGIENWNIELFLDQERSVVPYHYIEIWFTAFFSDLLRLNTQYALMLIVYPILYLTIFCGAMDLFGVIQKKLNRNENYSDKWLPFLILIITSCSFLYPNYIPQLKSDIWALAVHDYHKLVYVYLFILLIFHSIIKQEYLKVSLWVSLLVVCQINVAPAILITITLFYLYLTFIKRINPLYVVKLMGLPLITLLSFGLFYGIFGGQDNVSLSRDEFLGQFDSLSELVTLSNILGKTTIQIFIILLPYILLSVVCFRKIQASFFRDLAVFVFIAICSGLIAWGMFNQMHDSVQLWGNLFNPSVNVLIFIILTSVIVQTENKIKKIGLIALPIISYILHTSFTDFSYKRMEKKPIEISSMIELKEPKFVFIKDSSEYSNYFFKHEQIWVGQTHSLMRTYDPLIITSIGNHLIPIESKKEGKYQENSTFIRYVNNKKKMNSFYGYENAQLSFIKDFDIDFLLVKDQSLIPESISNSFLLQLVGEVDTYQIYSFNR